MCPVNVSETHCLLGVLRCLPDLLSKGAVIMCYQVREQSLCVR